MDAQRFAQLDLRVGNQVSEHDIIRESNREDEGTLCQGHTSRSNASRSHFESGSSQMRLFHHESSQLNDGVGVSRQPHGNAGKPSMESHDYGAPLVQAISASNDNSHRPAQQLRRVDTDSRSEFPVPNVNLLDNQSSSPQEN